MYIKKFTDAQEFYKLALAVGAQGVANMIKAHMIDEQVIIQLNRWASKLKGRAIELNSFNDGDNIWEEVLYVPSYLEEDPQEFVKGIKYCDNTAYGKAISLCDGVGVVENQYYKYLLLDTLKDYVSNRDSYILASEVLALL